MTEAEDKQWASFAHFGNIILLIPALIIYLVFKDRGPKVAVEGKEALNWTINVTAIVIIGEILSSSSVPSPSASARCCSAWSSGPSSS